MCGPLNLLFNKKKYNSLNYRSPNSDKYIKTPFINKKPENTPIVPKKCLYCSSLIYDKVHSDLKYHKECEITSRLIANNKKKQLSI